MFEKQNSRTINYRLNSNISFANEQVPSNSTEQAAAIFQTANLQRNT